MKKKKKEAIKEQFCGRMHSNFKKHQYKTDDTLKINKQIVSDESTKNRE